MERWLPQTAKLSVIVPLRAHRVFSYVDRLRFRENCDLSGTETIVVDDGSPVDLALEIENYCLSKSFRYVRLDTSDLEFSSPRARNAGINAASSDWIFLDDADIIYPSDFFQQIHAELCLLDRTPFNFLTVPIVYLSEKRSDAVVGTIEIDSHVPEILTGLMFEDPTGYNGNENIQHFAPATGIFAMRRKTAYRVALYDEDFEGWGGEDRDFAFRLLFANDRIAKPVLFENTKPWNLNHTSAFEGWRALYRLHGDYLARKGIYGYHLYHPNNAWRGDGARDNIKRAAEKAIEIAKSGVLLPVSQPGRQPDIIIGKNPHLLNTQILETLANPLVIPEPLPSESADGFARKIAEYDPNSVLIWNPYGSVWREQFYKALRDLGIHAIVGERGALPNSMYFDQGGLCVESPSYREDKWPKSLSKRKRDEVRQFIEQIRYGEEALEKQTGRVGASLLRSKLGVPSSTKILFAPLQLFDDTVTAKFPEGSRTYDSYIRELKKLSLVLPRDWVLVYKNHPLSAKKTSFSSGIAADNHHIHDLLEASDAVTVFNSGTGLIAMAFEKPVYYYGQCFYAAEGINRRFEKAPQMASDLNSLFAPSRSRIERFYSYLLHDFYSFADWEYETYRATENSMRVKLKWLRYRNVKIPGMEPQSFDHPLFKLENSVLFDIYRYFDFIQRSNAKNTAQTPKPKAVTAPAPKQPIKTPDAPVPLALSAPTQTDNDTIRKKPGYRLFASMTSPFMPQKLRRKMKENPAKFFEDSRSPITAYVGRRLTSVR